MVIQKSKAGYSAYIFLIMALSLNMMYLLPSDFHLGILTLRFISIIVNFGFYFLVVCKCGVSSKIKKIDGWSLTAIILVIIGTITAYFTYNQPIFSTFLIQIYIFSYTILFVPIRKLIDQGILSGNSIKKIVYAFGITLLALFLLQYFLQDKLLFLQVTKIERYGGSRFYLDSAYLALLVAIALSEIVKKKTIVFNLLIIVATVFVGWLFSYTAFGKHCRMVGSGQEATVQSGVDIRKTKLLAFVAAGVTGGVISLLSMARGGQVSTSTASNFASSPKSDGVDTFS